MVLFSVWNEAIKNFKQGVFYPQSRFKEIQIKMYCVGSCAYFMVMGARAEKADKEEQMKLAWLENNSYGPVSSV